MSLVGPRPERPELQREIEKEVPEFGLRLQARQMTNTALQKVNAHSFLVKYDGKEEELPFDYGFVCLGMRANAPIWNDIQEAFYENNYLRFYFYDMI